MDKGMRLVRLTDDYVFKPFDCGEKDLNEFLLYDSKEYLKRLVSVTYIIETDQQTVAFFSLSNDRVSISDSDKSTWRKIKRLFPHAKHRSDYPAVKIGRLGVDARFKGQHIGSDILSFVKTLFVTDNRTGCTFITVDALRNAIPFYEHNGFMVLDKSIADDETKETCPLYFDLFQLIKQ